MPRRSAARESNRGPQWLAAGSTRHPAETACTGAIPQRRSRHLLHRLSKTRKPMLLSAQCSGLQRSEFSGTISTSIERGRLAFLLFTWAGSRLNPIQAAPAGNTAKTGSFLTYEFNNSHAFHFYAKTPIFSKGSTEFPTVSYPWPDDRRRVGGRPAALVMRRMSRYNHLYDLDLMCSAASLSQRANGRGRSLAAC
jgi:hypothetical protein